MLRFVPPLVAVTLSLVLGASRDADAQGMITVSPPATTAEPAERPVTYAQPQVASGRRAYDQYCVMCHGANLDDGEFGGPPLVGRNFEETWGGQPVSSLYGYIEATMPPDRPGRIGDRERTDIVAYILSRNGYPEGAALPADINAMDYLMVEK